MTDETEYKTRLVAQCKILGAYARRFEDRYAVGILDVLVAFDSMPVCFIEGKIIRGRSFSPTERQYIEGIRIQKLRGGHSIPLAVGWTAEDGTMYVGDWARNIPITACTKQLKGDDFATTLWRHIRDRTQQDRR